MSVFDPYLSDLTGESDMDEYPPQKNPFSKKITTVPIGRGTSGGGGGGAIAVPSVGEGESVASASTIISINDGESIGINPNGEFVANGNSEGIQQIAQMLNKELDELSTQFKSENVELIVENLPSLKNLNAIVNSIVVTDNSDTLSVAHSSALSVAYSSASSVTQVKSVLESLKNPNNVFEIIKQKPKTNFTITGEINDLTIALIQWMIPHNINNLDAAVNYILENNNVYGLIKFCCANGIQVSEFLRNEIDFFYYELVCMRTSTTVNMLKSTARNYREFLLDFCRRNEMGFLIFHRIYHMLSEQGNGFKVCGVGGNVIKEYCLALRYALNWQEEQSIDPEFNEIFTSVEEIRKTKAFVQAQIQANPNFAIWLDFLCDKCSDTDLSVFETPSLTGPTGPTYVQSCFKAIGIALSMTLTEITNGRMNLCRGNVIFLLERIKFKQLCDPHSIFLQECYNKFYGQPIINYDHTLEQAQQYFPGESWFPQMISDDDFTTKYPRRNLSERDYNEIAKLHCVLQKLKGMNSEFTKCISEIIAKVDIDSRKPDSQIFGAVKEYTKSVCKNAVVSLNTRKLKSGCFCDVEIIKSCSGPIHKAFVKNMSDGLPKNTLNEIMQMMPNKIRLMSLRLASYKNGGAWYPASTHFCVEPGLDFNTMNDFYAREKTKRSSKLATCISSTSNWISFEAAVNVNPCGPQEEESDNISVHSTSKPATPTETAIGRGTAAAAPSKMRIKPPEKKITSTINEAFAPSGGGGGGAATVWTKETLNYSSHASLLKKCSTNEIQNYTKYRQSTEQNKTELIKLLLEKQREGSLLGGAKPRKTRKRGKRGMRKTRKGTIA